MSTVDDNELWDVQLASGQIVTAALDHLDGAFHEGKVSAQTLIRPHGTLEWSTLGVVAGLEDADVNPAVVPSQAPPPSMPNSLAPMTAEMGASYNNASSTDRSARELELDTPIDFGGGSRKQKFLAAVVAAVAVAAGAIAYVASGSGSTDAPATAEKPPAAAPAPQPLAEAARPTAEPQPDALSDDKRKALLEADKKRAEAAKARVRPASGGAARPSTGGNVFHSGGSKFDPLNGSL